MNWLRKMRGVPEYVEIYGDPANVIAHFERTVGRVELAYGYLDRLMRRAAIPTPAPLMEMDLRHHSDAPDLWPVGKYGGGWSNDQA